MVEWLEEIALLQARVPTAGDDDVIMDRDPEGLKRIDKLVGHLDIGGGWRGIAGRVIVGQDQRTGVQLERAARNLARIDRNMINRPLAHGFVGDQNVALVEKQNAELSVRRKAIALFR